MIRTREKILKTSQQIMKRDGVDGLSMRKIAKKIGIQQSVLYYHLENKQAILVEFMEQLITKMTQEIEQSLAGIEIATKTDLEKAFEKIILISLKHGKEGTSLYFGNSAKKVSFRRKISDKIIKSKLEFLQKYFEIIKGVLAIATEKKIIKKVDYQFIGDMIGCTVRGYVMMSMHMAQPQENKTRFAQQYAKILVDGIAR